MPNIDVSSFSDIAFLLIIFFILTTTFVKLAGGKMRIPAGSSEGNNASKKQTTIRLTPGSIRINNRPVSIDVLRDDLKARNLPEKSEDQRMIIVDSHPEVTYEKYYKVVMAITDAGGILALMDKE